MNGIIITKAVNHIEPGTVGILLNEKKILDIITVMEINDNGIVIAGAEYNGICTSEMHICKLMVEHVKDRHLFPLKFNQWRNAINANEVNTGKTVEFRLNHLLFKKGNNLRVCTDCNKCFMGNRYQDLCQDCCKKYVSAQTILTKENPKQVVNAKLKTGINSSTTKLIAIEAYKKGLKGESYKSVTKWLEKQL